MKLYPIESGNFKLDGGAMFGVVPKTIWNKTNPADENNLIDLATRCLLIEDGNRLILIDNGMGNKQSEKFFGYYSLWGTHSIDKSLAKYGFHRDELDFIMNARQLEWGYVAYPPITPFIARIGLELFGNSLPGLRLFSALGQGVVMVLAGLMARDMGGKRGAQADPSLGTHWRHLYEMIRDDGPLDAQALRRVAVRYAFPGDAQLDLPADGLVEDPVPVDFELRYRPSATRSSLQTVLRWLEARAGAAPLPAGGAA